MSDNPTAARDAAAEAYARKARDDVFFDLISMSFRAGADWALAKAPEVLALVERFHLAIRQWEYYMTERDCDDLSELKHIEAEELRASKTALANWRERTGGV